MFSDNEADVKQAVVAILNGMFPSLQDDHSILIDDIKVFKNIKFDVGVYWSENGRD